MLRAPAFRKREGTPAHVIGVLNQPAPVDPAYPATPGLPEHISPTSAKAYLACSLKFFFEKLVRLAKPVPVALHCGKAVHAALQAFHLARWRGRDDSPEVIAAAFEGAFVALERDEGPVNCADAAAREKARNDGLRVVAAYLDSPEALAEPPKAVEVHLHERIGGRSVPLTGAVDLVRRDLTPVDFKSAAARPDPEQAAFEHELQLVAYQLMLEAATGEKPPALELVYLSDQDQDPAGVQAERPARRPAPQGAGGRDAGNRGRRHRRRPLPPAAGDAVLVVPVPRRVRGVDPAA